MVNPLYGSLSISQNTLVVGSSNILLQRFEIDNFLTYAVLRKRQNQPIMEFNLTDIQMCPRNQVIFGELSTEELNYKQNLKLQILAKLNEFNIISCKLRNDFSKISKIKAIPIFRGTFPQLSCLVYKHNLNQPIPDFFGQLIQRNEKKHFRQLVLKHSCILPLIGWTEFEGTQIYLLYKYLKNTLLKYMQTNKGEIENLIKKCLWGIEYLHSKKLHLVKGTEIYVKSGNPVFGLIDFTNNIETQSDHSDEINDSNLQVAEPLLNRQDVCIIEVRNYFIQKGLIDPNIVDSIINTFEDQILIR